MREEKALSRCEVRGAMRGAGRRGTSRPATRRKVVPDTFIFPADFYLLPWVR